MKTLELSVGITRIPRGVFTREFARRLRHEAGSYGTDLDIPVIVTVIIALLRQLSRTESAARSRLVQAVKPTFAFEPEKLFALRKSPIGRNRTC
jgi:hypothetical protein